MFLTQKNAGTQPHFCTPQTRPLVKADQKESFPNPSAVRALRRSGDVTKTLNGNLLRLQMPAT